MESIYDITIAVLTFAFFGVFATCAFLIVRDALKDK